MDELLFLEPRTDLDQFIVGVGTGFGGALALVYDKDKLLEYWTNSFMQDVEGLEEEEAYFMAVEWFEYNVIGAYVGEHTPIYVSKDELDIFMQDYEVISAKQQSILEVLESMSSAEVDHWREAFDMATQAEFALTKDNWLSVLEGFLNSYRKEQYTKSLKRWTDLRDAHPSVFTPGDQPPLPIMGSDFNRMPEKEVLGWREDLSFKEKTGLLDSQFKRDFARVIESSFK